MPPNCSCGALRLDLTRRGSTSVENREATEMVVDAFEQHREAKATEYAEPRAP